MEKSVDTRFFARPSDRMYANILRSMNPRQKPAYRRIESVSVIQATIRAKSSGALPSEISVTLFLPFLYLARLSGTEASEQQPPLLLDFFLARPRVVGSNRFPQPTACRFG